MKAATYDKGNISEGIVMTAYLKAGFIVSKVCDGDGCLRLDPAHNGQQKLIRRAKDFTWEKHIEELTRSVQNISQA